MADGEPGSPPTPDPSSDPGLYRTEVALAGSAMPVWLPRAIGVLLFGLAGLYVANALIVRLRTLIILLIVSLFASFAIEPAVNWLESKGLRRGLGTFGVLFGLFVLAVGFTAVMGSVIVNEVADFVEQAPEYIEELETWINDNFDADFDADDLIDEISSADADFQQVGSNVAAKALSVTGQAVGLLFSMFTAALFTFYLVADGPRFRRQLCSLLRPDRQRAVLRGWEIAIDKTGGYIYSRLLLAILCAVITTTYLWIIGVPYAIALGLWTGLVSQFVPTVGTYIGGALPVLVALFEDPVDGVLVLAFIVVYQQIENYFFLPRITARTMELHPAVAFGTVIAGASIAGGIGAILALPAAAVIQAVGSTYLQRHDVIESEMTKAPLKADRRSIRDRLRGVRDDSGGPVETAAGGDGGESDSPTDA
jgi:predicted PurR-regulated permease PerM